MLPSSLEKSLNMLKDVQARLSNALTIQPKNSNQVIIELKDVKVKPKQESTYQKSGRSQAFSTKLSNHHPSSRLQTYESQYKSPSVQQLQAQNKELKNYISVLQSINKNLCSQVKKLMKQQDSFSIPKDISIFYESDHLSMMRNQLECLRKINSVQKYQIDQLKQHKMFENKDIYQYLSPQKLQEQKKRLSRTQISIPEYNGYCQCDGRFKTLSKMKLRPDKSRCKTQYRQSTSKVNKVGTISKKKYTKI